MQRVYPPFDDLEDGRIDTEIPACDDLLPYVDQLNVNVLYDPAPEAAKPAVAELSGLGELGQGGEYESLAPEELRDLVRYYGYDVLGRAKYDGLCALGPEKYLLWKNPMHELCHSVPKGRRFPVPLSEEVAEIVALWTHVAWKGQACKETEIYEARASAPEAEFLYQMAYPETSYHSSVGIVSALIGEKAASHWFLEAGFYFRLRALREALAWQMAHPRSRAVNPWNPAQVPTGYRPGDSVHNHRVLATLDTALLRIRNHGLKRDGAVAGAFALSLAGAWLVFSHLRHPRGSAGEGPAVGEPRRPGIGRRLWQALKNRWTRKPPQPPRRAFQRPRLPAPNSPARKVSPERLLRFVAAHRKDLLIGGALGTAVGVSAIGRMLLGASPLGRAALMGSAAAGLFLGLGLSAEAEAANSPVSPNGSTSDHHRLVPVMPPEREKPGPGLTWTALDPDLKRHLERLLPSSFLLIGVQAIERKRGIWVELQLSGGQVLLLRGEYQPSSQSVRWVIGTGLDLVETADSYRSLIGLQIGKALILFDVGPKRVLREGSVYYGDGDIQLVYGEESRGLSILVKGEVPALMKPSPPPAPAVPPPTKKEKAKAAASPQVEERPRPKGPRPVVSVLNATEWDALKAYLSPEIAAILEPLPATSDDWNRRLTGYYGKIESPQLLLQAIGGDLDHFARNGEKPSPAFRAVYTALVIDGHSQLLGRKWSVTEQQLASGTATDKVRPASLPPEEMAEVYDQAYYLSRKIALNDETFVLSRLELERIIASAERDLFQQFGKRSDLRDYLLQGDLYPRTPDQLGRRITDYLRPILQPSKTTLVVRPKPDLDLSPFVLDYYAAVYSIYLAVFVKALCRTEADLSVGEINQAIPAADQFFLANRGRIEGYFDPSSRPAMAIDTTAMAETLFIDPAYIEVALDLVDPRLARIIRDGGYPTTLAALKERFVRYVEAQLESYHRRAAEQARAYIMGGNLETRWVNVDPTIPPSHQALAYIIGVDVVFSSVDALMKADLAGKVGEYQQSRVEPYHRALDQAMAIIEAKGLPGLPQEAFEPVEQRNLDKEKGQPVLLDLLKPEKK